MKISFRKYLKSQLAKLLKLETHIYYGEWAVMIDPRGYQACEIVRDTRRRALEEGFDKVAARCVPKSNSLELCSEIVSGCLALLDTPKSSSLSVNQAAEHLGLSTKTIYQLCANRKLPHKRIGRTIKIERAELEKFSHSAGNHSDRSVTELEKCFE